MSIYKPCCGAFNYSKKVVYYVSSKQEREIQAERVHTHVYMHTSIDRPLQIYFIFKETLTNYKLGSLSCSKPSLTQSLV